MNWNHLGGLIFFAIALAGTTAAQPAPVRSILNGLVPPIVSAEGTAELVGDVLLACTGGTPTELGAEVPRTNVQVLLNTSITSRIVGSAVWSEVLLMIDEPAPGSQVYCSPTEATPCSGAKLFQGRRTAGPRRHPVHLCRQPACQRQPTRRLRHLDPVTDHRIRLGRQP